MFNILSVVYLALLSAASPQKPLMRLDDVHQGVPAGFVALKSADADTPLHVRLVLKQRDSQGMVETLLRVGNPKSPDYGNYLSQQEIAEKFSSPEPGTLAAVHNWLNDNDIHATPASYAGDWIQFTVPVWKANALFDANFTVFEHTKSGTRSIRTLHYSFPAALQSSILTMYPGALFLDPTSKLELHAVSIAEELPLSEGFEQPTAFSPFVSEITPSRLQALYGIPTHRATQPGNGIAVAGFNEQYANKADLEQFLQEMRPDMDASTSFATLSVDGGKNPQDRSQAGSEANADIQYTVGLATGVPVSFVSVGQTLSGRDVFEDLVNFLINTQPEQKHKILTLSYALDEDYPHADKVFEDICNSLAGLALTGVPIIVSSGDGGVGGGQKGKDCRKFVATFPSTCFAVTSVGATSGIPERGAGFSTGGFSSIFGNTFASEEKKAAMDGYRACIGDLHSDRYRHDGDGFPDVSAMGDDVVFFWDGERTKTYGTSFSAPIFASIIALINDRLLAAKKKPLGFLTSFLYQHPEAFNDITTGHNPGCGTDGFPVHPGWDPVTGLGTPIFSKLLEAALQSQPPL